MQRHSGGGTFAADPVHSRADHSPADETVSSEQRSDLPVALAEPANDLAALRRALGNRAFGALLRAQRARLLQRDSVNPPLAKGSTSYWPGLAPPTTPPPAPVSLFERPTSQADKAGAKKAMEEYRKLSPAARKAAFDASYPTGSLAKVLALLGSEEAATNFAVEVRELTRWAEESETRKASGMTDAQMADAEAKWLYAKNKKAAEAKAGGKPVSDADVEKGRKDAEAAQSYYHPMAKTRYDALKPAERTAWDKKAADAIAAMVAYAAAHHPELKLTAANLVWDPNAIDKNAPGALGQGRGPGTATVGFEFVDVTKVDPAYAMSTVVHELFGHPEFDDPTNYQLSIFNLAGPKIPGYTSDPDAEGASYGYHESEIYSLMRELPYWTQVSAKNKKWASVNYDPRSGIGWQLDAIKSEWEPAIAAALVRGLYRRFALDPRIQPMALTAFSELIKKKFPAEHASIVK